MKKEVASYEKEVITNEARIQKMRDDGKDEYGKHFLVWYICLYTTLHVLDIRKQEEVLQESYMMIPDSKNRLGKAVDELDSLLQEVTEEDAVNAEILEEAKALVAELAVE